MEKEERLLSENKKYNMPIPRLSPASRSLAVFLSRNIPSFIPEHSMIPFKRSLWNHCKQPLSQSAKHALQKRMFLLWNSLPAWSVFLSVIQPLYTTNQSCAAPYLVIFTWAVSFQFGRDSSLTSTWLWSLMTLCTKSPLHFTDLRLFWYIYITNRQMFSISYQNWGVFAIQSIWVLALSCWDWSTVHSSYEIHLV